MITEVLKVIVRFFWEVAFYTMLGRTPKEYEKRKKNLESRKEH